MEAKQGPDFGAFAVKQNDISFRSPNIMRRNLGKEALAAHSVKKSRRAKSTEPTPLEPNDPFIKYASKNQYGEISNTVDSEEGLSLTVKDQENVTATECTNLSMQMSKSELINCYRLLMNEKLRLERFLSIMSKNNEMMEQARNRLESDLLDAMMCIEDLKQALELRMARRRKIDPREAEERRYLIRQNKKLLNQLYESAKKIERLELTKVEMKEQLELLDFQILEVENQKTMMEEELRRLPSCNHSATQTDDCPDDEAHLVAQLQEQLNSMKSDLVNQKAETAAKLARQQHLENLVRDLRRDNVDLRDQLAKLDDAENSLAESDKPIAAGTRMLQIQLEQQTERVRELQIKLNASREYTDQLETRIQQFEQTHSSTHHLPEMPSPTAAANQASMHESMERSVPGLRAPRVDDKLLQETIRTFHMLLKERDEELAQLKQHIRQHASELGAHEDCKVMLPQLFETAVQTDLVMEQAQKLSSIATTLTEGGLLLTYDQSHALMNEVYQCIDSLALNESAEDDRPGKDQFLGFTDLLTATNRLRTRVQQKFVPETRLNGDMDPTSSNRALNSDSGNEDMSTTSSQSQTAQPASSRGRKRENNAQDNSVRMTTSMVDSAPGRKPHSPDHYNGQLEELRQASDTEAIRANLAVSERRRQELERRVLELTEELARARAEARSSETSLTAARRTEAALRRRLLVAMDMQGSGMEPNSVRHSYSGTLSVGTEARDAVELQAELIKAEATNAALVEAAHLDRSRLHEQAMRIGQFEAEHRALLDRISILQTTEANAQRGIVRLQALYEDMLREYSESRSQELNWRSRERSRSNYRQQQADPKASKPPVNSRTEANVSKLQRQLADLENENRSLKEALNLHKTSVTVDNSHPVGPCTSPTCVEVRKLLKAFQERFTEAVEEAEQCLDLTKPETASWSKDTNKTSSDMRNALITSLRNKLTGLEDLLKPTDTELDSARLGADISTCRQLLTRLEGWLERYIQRTDHELSELRNRLVEIQVASVMTEPPIVTSFKEPENSHQFSCSINLSNKANMDLLSEREQEIKNLRAQLRQLESEMESSRAQLDSQVARI